MKLIRWIRHIFGRAENTPRCIYCGGGLFDGDKYLCSVCMRTGVELLKRKKRKKAKKKAFYSCDIT